MAAIDLDREQWQQLKVVLTEALKLSSADRAEMLNRVLANSPTLRERAFEMLQYYDRASRPFGTTETQSETLALHVEAARQSALGPGTVVGNYQIVRKLGQGGMGVVYLAQDQRLGREVALKFLFPSVREKPRGTTAQMLAEARSAAVLNHPGIVTFHDVFEDRGELVAVMEYVDGRPLGEVIAGQPLPLGFALRIAGQLADALAYAHGRGIIHCDLKPANIHVLPNGMVKILDFGIAKAVAVPEDYGESGDRPVFGTAGYLSPERLLGRDPTASSDVYALGIVFFQLLTGVPPFRTDDDAQLFLDTLTATPPAPSSLVAAIPPEVDDIVRRCLSKNARERMQPHELLRALNGVLRDLETAPVPFTALNLVGSTERASDRQTVTGTTGVVVQKGVAGRAVVTVLASVAALTFCGFITSISYNGPLGLVGRFATESALLWPVWGFRSLIAVAGQLTLELLAVLIISGVGRLVYATVRPIRPTADRISTSMNRLATPVRAAPAAMVAPGILLAQLLVIGLLAWRFQPILNGLDSFLTRSSTTDLWALGPQNHADQNLLTELLVANLLVFGAVWYWLFKRLRSGNERDGRTLVWGGITMLAFSIVIFQVTLYRVIYHNDAERVTYKGDACYLVGQRLDEALLFCPRRASPPLDQIVNVTDSNLKREGSYEKIFAAVDRQR